MSFLRKNFQGGFYDNYLSNSVCCLIAGPTFIVYKLNEGLENGG